MSFIKQTTSQGKEYLINLNQVTYIERTDGGFIRFNFTNGSFITRGDFDALEKELCSPSQSNTCNALNNATITPLPYITHKKNNVDKGIPDNNTEETQSKESAGIHFKNSLADLCGTTSDPTRAELFKQLGI